MIADLSILSGVLIDKSRCAAYSAAMTRTTEETATVTDQLTSLKGSLHLTGRRLTGQRKLLLELIQARPGHLDAHELHRLAREHDPEISLATVYRTLAILRDLGLVDELHLGEEHHHYELKPKATHHHLTCRGLRSGVEFRSVLAEKLQQAVAREHDFEITEASVDLVGYSRRVARIIEIAESR